MSKASMSGNYSSFQKSGPQGHDYVVNIVSYVLDASFSQFFRDFSVSSLLSLTALCGGAAASVLDSSAPKS